MDPAGSFFGLDLTLTSSLTAPDSSGSTPICMVVSENYQGCVSYGVQPDGGSWASGKGPDYASAYWDAADKLPVQDENNAVYVKCWLP